jgi:hypothetical protein
MCHTQFKKQKIIWTLSSIFVQAHPADFCKNTSNEKNSNSPLLLEIKKTKFADRSVIVCCQFFLSKINRLFLIRDAKFKMNQKIKIRRIQNFRHRFFQGKTENENNFCINTEKQ